MISYAKRTQRTPPTKLRLEKRLLIIRTYDATSSCLPQQASESCPTLGSNRHKLLPLHVPTWVCPGLFRRTRGSIDSIDGRPNKVCPRMSDALSCISTRAPVNLHKTFRVLAVVVRSAGKPGASDEVTTPYSEAQIVHSTPMSRRLCSPGFYLKDERHKAAHLLQHSLEDKE